MQPECRDQGPTGTFVDLRPHPRWGIPQGRRTRVRRALPRQVAWAMVRGAPLAVGMAGAQPVLESRTLEPNMIGAYGPWAASLAGEGPARLSFRNPRFR